MVRTHGTAHTYRRSFHKPMSYIELLSRKADFSLARFSVYFDNIRNAGSKEVEYIA